MELLVAMGLFGIFSAMTATSVAIMNDNSVASNRLGNAAETSQFAASAVIRALADTVSPSTLQSFDGKYSSSLPYQNCTAAGIPAAAVTETADGSGGNTVTFCSYGVVGNSTTTPDTYSLEICAGGAATRLGSLVLADETSGRTLVTLPNLVCSSTDAVPPVGAGQQACPSQSEPTSYIAFYTSDSCSFTPPGTGLTSVFLSLTVSAMPHGGTDQGGGSAPPTTISKVVNMPNLSGVL